jgi:hypothetical protein
MPMLIHISHLDRNILVLPSTDGHINPEIFSFRGTFSMIKSQMSSSLLTIRNAKPAQSLQVGPTCSFPLHFTVKTNILSVSLQALTTMKITARNNRV